MDVTTSINSAYNLPSVRNFEQLHSAVCKDQGKVREMADLVGSFESKLTAQRQERIKRLMQIDEQVMKL